MLEKAEVAGAISLSAGFGTNSPFAALHKSGSYRGFIYRACRLARSARFDPLETKSPTVLGAPASPRRCALCAALWVTLNLVRALYFRCKRVASAADRLDQARVIRVGFDLLAQPRDQIVDRTIEG